VTQPSRESISEHDITGDPVAPCDDEYARGVLAQSRERRAPRRETRIASTAGRAATHEVFGASQTAPDRRRPQGHQNIRVRSRATIVARTACAALSTVAPCSTA
jgi:hypothetical protein